MRKQAKVIKKSAFSKYRGIGNPGIGPGRKGIARWLRALRGRYVACSPIS